MSAFDCPFYSLGQKLPKSIETQWALVGAPAILPLLEVLFADAVSTSLLSALFVQVLLGDSPEAADELLTALKFENQSNWRKPVEERRRTMTDCPMKVIGRCSGKGMAKTVDLKEEIDKATREMVQIWNNGSLVDPFVGGGTVKRKLYRQILTGYVKGFVELFNCTERAIQSQVLPKIEYCPTGETRKVERCVESRIVNNRD